MRACIGTENVKSEHKIIVYNAYRTIKLAQEKIEAEARLKAEALANKEKKKQKSSFKRSQITKPL